jgi:4-hydroxy-2-oxoheptanedioate aldolase
VLNTNWLLKRIQESDIPCIGTWITLPSITTLDVICSAGPDFVIIDCEHSPISLETAQDMVIVCESRQVSPLLRIPEVTESSVLRALETGVHGLQVPNVGAKETMSDVASYARYTPHGKKGFSPYTRACGYSAHNSDKMVHGANDNTLLIAQIEGETGIQNIDSIFENPEFDICFVGLYDLSNFIGHPGELEHPDVRALFEQIVRKISDAGIVAGSISNTEKQMKYLIDAGVRYITHSADCHMLKAVYQDAFSFSKCNV